MFGTNNASSTGTFGNSQAKPSGFSFGASTNNSAPGANGSSSGFSLGGSNSNALGGFGSKPAGSGFGSTNTNSSTGGLFGNTNSNQSQSTSGGLFGNNNNGQSSGLFGSNSASNTATNNQASTGLFGNNNTSSGFSASKPLFGGSTGTSGAQTSGLFGNTQNSQSNQNTGLGGVFGSSTSQNQSNGAGSGLFGSNPINNNTVNGSISTQQPFNNTNNSQPSFSWTNQQQTSMGSGSLKDLEIKLPSNSKSQQSTSQYTPAINDQLVKLKEQWDPNSAKCALKTHFYNKVAESDIAALMQQPRPATETPEDWEKAMASRPSPSYYPVKVTSFSEVAQRVEVQLEHVVKSRMLLNNIHDKSTQLSSQRELDTTTRILKAKVRHTKLSRRLLKLATLLAVLKLKGYPLLPEEEEIAKQFHVLNAKLSDPNGAFGKLSDLYARLAILKGRSEDLSLQLESSFNSMNGGLDKVTNNKVGDDDKGTAQSGQVVQQLTKLLYKQQIGLGYLNDVLQRDLAIVQGKAEKR